MPKKVARRFRAWSFSRWRDYEGCPARANWKYLEKLQVEEERSPALERGSAVHAEAQKFVREGGKLPKSLDSFEHEFAILRRAYESGTAEVITEEQWALNDRWKPTGWFDGDAWVRTALDSMIFDARSRRAVIIDYKTGKIRKEEQEPQLELYAAVALSRIDGIDEVSSSLWYLDHGIATRRVYPRAKLEGLRKAWEKRTKKMLTDERFDPTPSDACRWCPFQKSKGGPCKY